MDIIFRDLSSKEKKKLAYNADAIKNSLKNILNTRKGSFPGNPIFGSDLSDYIFELADGLTNSIIKDEIEQAILNFEKRVKIESVDVNVNEAYNSMVVDIYFSIKEDISDEIQSVSVTF
jgi:phage baseplate assembly protein W